jgi:hypothetical protein
MSILMDPFIVSFYFRRFFTWTSKIQKFSIMKIIQAHMYILAAKNKYKQCTYVP